MDTAATITSRTRVKNIVEGKPVDRCAFWLGEPKPETWEIYYRYFGTESQEEIRRLLHDDVRWIGLPVHPRRKPEDPPEAPDLLPGAGCFAETTDPAEVASYSWPDPEAVDLSETLKRLCACDPSLYRVSGHLAMFFHGDCFNALGGMAGYFTKMYTNPEVVHELTRRANDYYLAVNRRFYAQAGDLVDAVKLSHDLGTQLALLVSREMLEEFVFPYLKDQIDLGHEFGYPVYLHCCGGIRDIIPRLIELGIDILDPLQANAVGMESESLAEFRGQVTFVGGIDVQDLLVNGTPEQVKASVRHVVETLGPMVVSPSHETILPNVPPENILSVADAVTQDTVQRGGKI